MGFLVFLFHQPLLLRLCRPATILSQQHTTHLTPHLNIQSSHNNSPHTIHLTLLVSHSSSHTALRLLVEASWRICCAPGRRRPAVLLPFISHHSSHITHPTARLIQLISQHSSYSTHLTALVSPHPCHTTRYTLFIWPCPWIKGLVRTRSTPLTQTYDPDLKGHKEGVKKTYRNDSGRFKKPRQSQFFL